MSLSRKTRTDWAASLLAFVAVVGVVLASEPAIDISHGRRGEADGLVLLAYAILVTGCLCTAAVLWVRGDRPR